MEFVVSMGAGEKVWDTDELCREVAWATSMDVDTEVILSVLCSSLNLNLIGWDLDLLYVASEEGLSKWCSFALTKTLYSAAKKKLLKAM